MWCEVRDSTSFFSMWISRIPSTICWQDYSFPIELSWHPCRKSVVHKVGVFWWTLNSILLLYVYPYIRTALYMPAPYFVVSLEIGKYESSNFVFLFQDCFELKRLFFNCSSCSESIAFYGNFWISLSVSVMKLSRILIGVALNL